MAEGHAGLGLRLYGRAADHVSRRAEPADAVDAHLRAGRLAMALSSADAALLMPIDATVRARVRGLRSLALSLGGRAEEALAALERSDRSGDGRNDHATLGSCWAESALWAGLPHRAIDRAAGLLDRDGAPEDHIRALLARAWSELELDRAPAPLRLRATIDVTDPDWAAALAELRGIEAMARAAWRPAAAAFGEAEGRWAGRHAPRALVCRWGAGEARRRCGDDGAAAELRSTLAAATAMGFEPLAARIRRSLRLAGDRPVVPRTPVSVDGLTSREREVLGLVSRGRTNGEIARRMGLGRPTVARLLSNAMVKLGADSRAHAIAIHGCADQGAQDDLRAGALAPAIQDDARSILARIASGHTLGAIARDLGLSRRTADRRLADARVALGVERTTEAIARAQRLGWLT